jgi:hypothetical protein
MTQKDSFAKTMQSLGFERVELPIDEAIAKFEEMGQRFKVELLNDLKTKGTTSMSPEELEDVGGANVSTVSLYTTGEFTDLCRGPHVATADEIGAVKLHKFSAVYWRGKDTNPSMQRIYGLCFATQEELDAFVTMQEEAARRETGHRGIYGADRAKMLVTIPCPSLAFEWVAAVNGFPLGLIIQMVGFPKVGKSGMLAEFFRWFDMVGGGGELKECETKFSDIWYSSIMTPEAYERMGLERCESVDDWQAALTKTIDRHQRVMLGTKEKPGIGRIIPICFGVDTIMGKMSQSVQEAIHGKKLPDGTHGKTGTGFAGRGHPVEALIIAKYLRTFPQRLDGWPFTAVFVNHVSVKVNPDTNQEERNKPGGKLVGYQESLELQLSRPSTKDIRTPHFEGHLVDISNHASSIGPGGRMCRTRLLWTYYRDAQGQRRQRTVWDWDWSTVWLLHRIMEDAKFSPQVRRHLREAGFHLKVVESGTTDNAAYSTTLGMRADQAVTWRELGRRIRNNAAVMKMLRDCLVIQECPHLRGPYLEQLNALAAEQP